jgi:NAD(P)-dependent dehydrogenase (short-subunit alcohol dehydrogenase family)
VNLVTDAHCENQFDGRTATAAEIVAGHDLTGTDAVVTGGYGGVGYETSRALASAGARVVIAGRDPGKGADALDRLTAETGNEEIVFSQLDLGSLASVEAWAREYVAGGRPLHLLVNNAGVMWPPQRRTEDGFESHLAVNHLAHFALTVGLLPCLQAAGDARVICLTSSGHRRSDINYEDPNYDRRHYDPAEAYGQSKTANALFAVGFSARFAGPHPTANAVMPGGIRTDLMRNLTEAEFRARGWIDADGNDLREGWKSPEQGAATTIWAAVAPELQGVSGKYLEDCAIATPLAGADRPLGGNYDPQMSLRGHYQSYALDPDNAERLWTLSERLIDSVS